MCSTMYEGLQCREILKSFQSCLSGQENDSFIYISDYVSDQATREEEIGTLLYGLDTFIKPSHECREKVVPFLCLFTFGLCQNGINYWPTIDECVDIRDVTCKSEWSRASDLLSSLGQQLPDCNTLGNSGITSECVGK